MDYVHKFDVELDKEMWYAGEMLTGRVLVETSENLRVKGIRLTLRGKAHTEWKITRAGERRTVKEDEYYIDNKNVVWGKDSKHDDGTCPILPRGKHSYPFEFKLPETALPCSFESKIGTIRYYLRIFMDIPYASPPQGIKYFTIIGPHVDCMDDRYLSPAEGEDKSTMCCMCCVRGPVTLRATLERSAYCCGENIRLKAEINNGSDIKANLLVKLIQNVEYFINKGVLGLSKKVTHKILEYRGETVDPRNSKKHDDLQNLLQVPVMPPTMVDVCNLITVYYNLEVYVVLDKMGEMLEVDFPLTVATLPFRIPNCPSPDLLYDNAASNVEGGIYIGPEFQLGQVYMGDESTDNDDVILYRPVYVCVSHVKNTSNSKKEIENKNGLAKRVSSKSSRSQNENGPHKEVGAENQNTEVGQITELKGNADPEISEQNESTSVEKKTDIEVLLTDAEEKMAQMAVTFVKTSEDNSEEKDTLPVADEKEG